jgi:hypothetical protein
MRKQLTKTDEEFQMFSEYYKMYQDFYIPEDSDSYWQALIRTADEFCKKYNTKLAKDLVWAYLDSRDELYKLKKA